MKFIHTADIHWGMVPDSDRPWGKKREQAIRLTFQAIIEDARDSRADLLLISGDLFHRQPLARDLKEVNYLFSTIPGTRVVTVSYTHLDVYKRQPFLVLLRQGHLVVQYLHKHLEIFSSSILEREKC